MTDKSMTLDKESMANYPQQPHGGVLVDRVATGDELKKALERAASLPQIMIDLEAAITVEMIATGVLSPNDGFMNQQDYISVLEKGRFANGLVWPTPLSFAPIGETNEKVVASLKVGDEVALIDHSQTPIALLSVSDVFDYDREFRAEKLFGTTDRKHPGVDSIYRRMGDKALGGQITLLNRVDWGPFESIRLSPADTWRQFYEEKKFKSVAGFITGANPMHRGHEHMHRNMLEEVDGLLAQPLVEMAKREYTRHEYRMRVYQSVLEQYYPKERTVLAPLRVTYIFAGPRETILHALVMKNYGCTHAIVGRDHAGIGDYYDKYASHSIFDQFPPEELGIDVRLFHEVFYCVRCNTTTSSQACPHDESVHIKISGTGIREMLRHGIIPPKEIVRPESAYIALQGVQPKGRDAQGNTISPVGKLIKSIFPFYLTHTRLGGPKREVPLNPDDLSNADLEAVILDVRTNGDLIYKQTYEEYASAADINRNAAATWIDRARADMQAQQKLMVKDLEMKVAAAPESASDEFMYQDKAEASKELEAAKKMLKEIPPALSPEDTEYRVWNIADYDHYR
ncbi:sulfate adenylyltransferase [Parahaliea sp. F7430]|uniref:Sulfate adenylyltransferase n=1 Tax=Sediminihaliea albiluteola TaxID=2758564 RepID=A0A7W2YHU6_9GAMM|nr:sulfate adenylyltransferase [Sediminihaliea albiluteola]MBA6411816.1 sulfate adenylyltransferase [Sediminihaliea albiluteola]